MATTIEHEEESSGFNIFATLPVILWQRRWLILALTVIAGIAGGIAAWVIPPMFESSATVLIESQQLPNDVVGGSLDDAIDQRIARARERVLSRQDLIRLIRANNLYPEDQRSKPLSVIVDEMRNSTTIEAVAVNLGGGMQVTGRGTIALRIGYRYPDPVKAQIVAQQFVNHFLELDASAQADQAQGAATFLSEQANQLQSQIADIEGQIRRIKTEHGATLALQQQSTGNPAADATRIDGEIAGLQAQNAQLRASGGGGDGAVAAARAALQVARAKYSDSHPDVIAAKAQLEAAQQAGSGDSGAGTSPIVAANNAQIAALRAARGMMLSQSSSVRSAQQSAPLINDQIEQLQKREDLLRENYRVVASRTQSAQMSARMETEQKGERLSLADPPVVPDKPFRPNRPVILLGGIAAGLGLGLALTLLIELLMHPIRGTDALRAATGHAPLAIIPDYERRPGVILRWLERRSRRKSARAV